MLKNNTLGCCSGCHGNEQRLIRKLVYVGPIGWDGMGLRLCKVVHPAPSWMAQSSTLKILPYYIVVAECMVLFTVIGFYGNLGVKQGLPWKLFGLFVLSLGWDMGLRMYKLKKV